MDRATVYTQEQGRSVDFLFAQRSTMIGLGKLAQAIMGGNTIVRGLGVTPNSPAALNVLVGIGEIYSMAQVDATAWGALPADTADFIVKQGLNMAAQTIATPAPTTGGYSQAYLIEAQYQDQDTNPAVLPFYNSANPQIPLNGQGGNGATQATERQGVCVIQAKAGIPAATGTQITPTVDAGWTALAVVTVAFGQTTVVAGNITVPAGVPQVTSILQMMQTESTNYAVDTSSTPNQITIALTPPITAYTDGMQLNFRAANNSSNAVTINAGPGNISLSGAAGALQSGEIVANGYYTAVYQSNTGTAILVGQGAGAEQVNPATQPKHAVQFGQVSGVVGQTRNLVSNVATAAATKVVTADEVIVETALGGLRYCLASINLTGNLATQMDTGSAPASGFVAEYLIYNPNAAISATNPRLLYTNASTKQPNVYGGANMPTGYTASALTAVWPTNASSQFIVGYQQDRKVTFAPITILSSGSANVTLTALVAGSIPLNATACSGNFNAGSTGASTVNGGQVASNAGAVGAQSGQISATTANQSFWHFTDLKLITAQTLFWTWVLTGGTASFIIISVTDYTF